MKKIFVISGLFLAGLLMISACAANPFDQTSSLNHGVDVYIDVKPDATVRGEDIRVGDIATVTSSDIDISIKIDNMVIGRAPWPGNERIIEVGEVGMLLSNRGLDLSRAIFTGAGETTIRVKTLTISGKEIAKHAESYLRRKLKGEAEDIILELRQIPEDQVVPLGSGDVRLRFSRTGMSKNKEQVYLTAGILVDRSVYKSIAMAFDVKTFEAVVVAKKKILPGNVFSRDSVELETMEITPRTESGFDEIESIVGKVAKRGLEPGAIVSREVVEDMATVRKGDKVTILLESDGFKVTAKGICQEKGGPGDTVTVVNLDTEKVIYGSVIDSGTVKVGF